MDKQTRIGIGAGLFLCIVGLWFNMIPSPYNYIITAILFIIGIWGFWPLFCGYRKHHKIPRDEAIKHGANFIFEDKIALDTGNISKEWQNSAPVAEHNKFNEHENYLRIKNAYCDPVRQKITLHETSLSQSPQNLHEPVKFMTLEKTEFIRWLAESDNAAIPIPSTWFSS